ncbi:Hsp20/alpha crystallin family protein [Natronosalvus halobius]|uniref:Hsp20/alpha crystallin family protein n=1 Tax=Natronosalvus halobius TaxID=2953746 RepID=UPI0020A199F7|nr:Hsp20/alpha crystallin family protein [Natronosalvus halobius]USZ73121.1 Hsp20/alpha crystallin family protein [Natronosalvus halobius]
MSLRSLRETVGDTLYRQVGRARSHVQEHRSLPVDVLESEDSYLVVFDAAGAELGDLQVRYIDGTVKVRVERYRSYHDGFEMRFPGRGMTLDGETTLPDDALVNPDAGTATLTDVGTLQITIPKEGSIDNDGTDEAPAVAEDDLLEGNPDTMAPSDLKPGAEQVVVDD